MTDYLQLLDGLNESREHLRVMDVSGDQQNVDLARAFYRIESAHAAIQTLLGELGVSHRRHDAFRLTHR